MYKLPVAAFVYNRLDKAREMLASLSTNYGSQDIQLYIFSDGPKDNEIDIEYVKAVREYIRKLNHFKNIEIIEADKNKGLAESIIKGVSYVLEQHETVVVLEDDLVLSSSALEYFNTLLKHYRTNRGVFSISGYSPPETMLQIPDDYEYSVYFIPRMQCWGWATWRDRWNQADWSMQDYDKFINSESQKKSYIDTIGSVSLSVLDSYMKGEKDVWACRWLYTHFKYHALCVCPVQSLVINTGNDGSGTNCGVSNTFSDQVINTKDSKLYLPTNAFVDNRINSQIYSIYNPSTKPGEINKIHNTNVNKDNNHRSRNANKSIQAKRNLYQKAITQLKLRLIDISNSILDRLQERPGCALERLGTDYGGWYIPKDVITETDQIISAGAGEDISFDLYLVDKYQCNVHIVDPTPRAKKHYEETKELISKSERAPINNSDTEYYKVTKSAFDKIEYHEIGLWNKNKNVKFYEPKIKQHVSHSINNLHNTDNYFIAKCVRLDTFLNDLDITNFKLIKMDIEGAEYAVIGNILRNGIKPELLLVEFHPGKSRLENRLKIKTIFYILLLRIYGYHMIFRNKWDYVFRRINN